MFQVPIRAPTASRMKTALIAEVMPPTAASRTLAVEWPFLNATRAATTALVKSATWSGPPVASVPNRAMVSAMRKISATTGMSASSRLGSRGVLGRGGLGSGVGCGRARRAARHRAARPITMAAALGRCSWRPATPRARVTSAMIAATIRMRHDPAHPAFHRLPPQIGSRTTGQVMQCPPPRPLPSSNPSIVTTSTPASRIFAIVNVFRS